MAGESCGLSEEESPARPQSGSESQAPAISQWLQLMLAEIAAKREAHERARAEDALRSAEHGARSAEPRRGASRA